MIKVLSEALGLVKKTKLRRRLLLVLVFHDGRFVIQTKEPIHKPHGRYRVEALNLFKSVFGFTLGSPEIVEKGSFVREGVEWHPEIFWLTHLGGKILLEQADLNQVIVTPLTEHRDAEHLLKLLEI